MFVINYSDTTPLKTNMTLETPPVQLIGNTSAFMVDFPASHVSFRGVRLRLAIIVDTGW